MELLLVRNNKGTGIFAGRVVYIDHQEGHLSGNEEIFANCNVTSCNSTFNEADFLAEWYRHIKLGIIDDGAHRRDMDSLAVANLALSPLIADEIRIYRH